MNKSLVCFTLLCCFLYFASAADNSKNGFSLDSNKDTAQLDDVSERDGNDTIDFGQCFPNPCKNAGVCVRDGASEFRCDCRPSRTGRLCEYFICRPVPFWPILLPQPLYRKCTPPNICTLQFSRFRYRPVCVCDDPNSCSDAGKPYN